MAAVSLSTAGYQEYFVALTGNGNPEGLSFVARSLPGLPGPQPVAQIDDVSLQAIGSTPTTQSTSGTIAFADPDLNDAHTVETPVAEGTNYLGAFTVGPVTEAGGSGTVAWQFTVDGADIQYLAQGQELEAALRRDDRRRARRQRKRRRPSRSTCSTPTMRRSSPAGRRPGTVDEISLVTHSTAIDSTSGVVTFTDPDLTDTHTASASYVDGSAVWSGASAQNLTIPAQTLADLATAMTAQLTADSSNGATGSITWTASLPDKDLDFLAQGETLTATFQRHGGRPLWRHRDSSKVVVTFDGANDNPIATGATPGLTGVDPTNLVVNGGFEDGSANWTGVGFAGTSSSSPHTGADAGTLTVDTRHIPIPDSAYTQTISTVAGQGYLLSFWADAISFPAALQVDWNGASVGTLRCPPPAIRNISSR